MENRDRRTEQQLISKANVRNPPPLLSTAVAAPQHIILLVIFALSSSKI